jgi:excisionase family DNA binding protein
MPKTRGRILTVSELAEYLLVHRTTIYRLLRKGKLPGFRVGSDWRFHLDAIKQWQRDQHWQRDRMKDKTNGRRRNWDG